MKKVVVLINPRSGPDGNDGGQERAIRDAFRRHAVDAQICELSESSLRDAASCAAGNEVDAIVAAGGDGTVSAAANVVAGTDGTLGVLPLGTFNHFAKDLGIPLELERAVEVVATGTTKEVDVGEVNGRVFVNNSSIGIYADLVRRRDEHMRHRHRRKLHALVSAGFELLRLAPLVEVEIDAAGRRLRRTTPLVFVGNNVYELDRLAFGSRQRMTSGVLCVYTTRRSGRWGLFEATLRLLFNRLEQTRDFDLLAVEQTTIRSRRRRALVSLDGEVVEMDSELRYRVRPLALRVRVPREAHGEPA